MGLPYNGQRSRASRAERAGEELEDLARGSSGAARVREPGPDGTVPAWFFRSRSSARTTADGSPKCPHWPVMCYGADRDEAVARVQALALRVIADRLEHREAPAEFLNVQFQAA